MMRTIDPGKSPTCLLEFTYQVSATHLCMIHTQTSCVNRFATTYHGQRAGALGICPARPIAPMGAAAGFIRTAVRPQQDMISAPRKRPVVGVGRWPLCKAFHNGHEPPVATGCFPLAQAVTARLGRPERSPQRLLFVHSCGAARTFPSSRAQNAEREQSPELRAMATASR